MWLMSVENNVHGIPEQFHQSQWGTSLILKFYFELMSLFESTNLFRGYTETRAGLGKQSDCMQKASSKKQMASLVCCDRPQGGVLHLQVFLFMNVSVRGCGNARSCSAAGAIFSGSAFLLPVCPITSLPSSSHPSPHPLVPPALILISGARAAAVSTLLQSPPVPPFVLRPISVWQGSSSNRFHPPDPSPLNTPPAAAAASPFFFFFALS